MGHSSTVLIVDDQPLSRAVLKEVLSDLGYHIAMATSGPEALALAAELTPDIILLDVMMPDMDGFTVCRQIRADTRLAEIPIILITALDDRPSRLAGIGAGADDFISKPFDWTELRMRLQTILRLNRYRQLHRAREQFEWMLDHAREGFAIIDIDDHIQYANSRARRYLNVADDALFSADQTFLQLVREQYACEPCHQWESWPDLLLPGNPRYLVLSESPSTLAFWLRVDVLDLPSGSSDQHLIRLEDVTSHITLQRDMRSFHSMIIHKLRTPLIGLAGLAILEKHAADMSRAEIAELAQNAGVGVRRLRSEIEDIFQYLQIPSCAKPGQSVELNQLALMATQIANDLDIRLIEVHTPDPEQDIQVALSRRALELILHEIFENSWKFHPKQKPTIEVTVLPISDSAVKVQICDDGVMLSPDQAAHAWTPYYQGEKNFTGEIPGMGLGLSLVAILVWSAGGTCRIGNRSDRTGVLVELTLPMTNPPELCIPAASRTSLTVG